jgi:hypothetical protein
MALGTSLARWLWVALLLADAGCGRLAAESAPEAGTASDAPWETAEDVSVPPEFVGYVAVGAQAQGLNVGASFTGNTVVRDDAGQVPCPGTAMGACCYAEPSGFAQVPNGNGGLVRAGIILIQDGTQTLATLVPDGGRYYTSQTPLGHFNPGDTLGFSGSGDVVAAFDASLIAPGPVFGTMPRIGAADLVISRSSDWTLTWTPDSHANEEIQLTITDDINGLRARGIGCLADDSAGTVTVPAALLSKLNADDAGAILLDRLSVRFVNSGNASIAVYASPIEATSGVTFE